MAMLSVASHQAGPRPDERVDVDWPELVQRTSGPTGRCGLQLTEGLTSSASSLALVSQQRSGGLAALP
jgi:hypothetical protein